MIYKRIIIIAGLLTLPSASAFAYVDPGTGSMALQFLIGGLFAAAFTVKTYYYKIKSTIAKLFRPGDTASKPDIAAEKEDATSL